MRSGMPVFFLFAGLLRKLIPLVSRKKPAKNAKTVRDDNTKELFENGEWARNGACFRLAVAFPIAGDD